MAQSHYNTVGFQITHLTDMGIIDINQITGKASVGEKTHQTEYTIHTEKQNRMHNDWLICIFSVVT